MTLDAVLSWNDESKTESQFRIYRSQSPSPTWKADFSQLDTVPADTESYTDTDIPTVENLTYAVVAVNLAGKSSPTVSDTLDTATNYITASVTDDSSVSVSVQRKRSLSADTTNDTSVSVTLSRFPLVSRFTLEPDEPVTVSYDSEHEVQYNVGEMEVTYHDG